MRTLRAWCRLIALCVLTGVLTVIWLVGIPFTTRKGRRTWRSIMVGFWARRAIRIFHLTINVEGKPPEPPFFLVSNHLSYLDIVLYQTQMPCVFVAKSEVAHWPVIGWLARAIGTLFINRKSRRDVVRVNQEIQEALDHQEGIILFPEGTSSKGERVLPFKSAILATVTEHNRPVYYASLSYKTPDHEPPADQVICWWGDMTFADHVFDMLKLSRFEASIVFGDQPVQSTDRKELAIELREQITHNFVPVG